MVIRSCLTGIVEGAMPIRIWDAIHSWGRRLCVRVLPRKRVKAFPAGA